MLNSGRRCLLFTAVFLAWGLFPGGFSQSGQAGGAPPQAARFVPSGGPVPLHFVQNRGQVEPSVEFYARLASGFVYYYPDSIVYQSVLSSEGNDPGATMSAEDSSGAERPVRISNIRAHFVGASPQATMRGRDVTEARISHFRGNNPDGWVSGTPTYRRILNEGIYPGIDFVAAGTPGG